MKTFNDNEKSGRWSGALKWIAAGALILASSLYMNGQNSLPRPGAGNGIRPTQNSLPAPGTGGSFRPAPIGGFGNPGGPQGPQGPQGPWGYGPAQGWNNNWGNSWNNQTQWTSQGTENVLASGYDAQGVWRTIPLYVSYAYNGVNYNVTVINAWNPWGGFWNRGIDTPAYNTTYFMNGTTYDFYVPLSTGTYYFNL